MVGWIVDTEGGVNVARWARHNAAIYQLKTCRPREEAKSRQKQDLCGGFSSPTCGRVLNDSESVDYVDLTSFSPKSAVCLFEALLSF